MGFMRLQDFESSANIEWYAKISCGGSVNTLTYCEPSALAQDASNDDYIYFASLIQQLNSDSSIDTTQIQIRHFDKSGNEYWTAKLDLGDSSLSSYYLVKKLINSGSNLVIISEDTNTMLTYLTGHSTTDHTQSPGTNNNFIIPFTGYIDSWSNSGILYIVAYDTSQKLIKIDFSTTTYYIEDLGTTLRIFDTVFLSPGILYAGHASSLGTETFASQQGLIAFSDTSDTATNCVTSTVDWDPTTGGTTYTLDTSIVWSFITSNSISSTLETTLVLESSTITGTTSLLLVLDTVISQWCWEAVNIILSIPSDLGTAVSPATFSYTAESSMTATYNDFTAVGDSNCDAYSVSVTQASTYNGAAVAYPAIDTATRVITFDHGNNQYIDYDVITTLTATLPNGFVTTTPVEAVFTLDTISTCDTKTVAAPSSHSDFTASTGNGVATEFEMSQFVYTHSSGCALSYSFKITGYVAGTDGAASQSFVNTVSPTELPDTTTGGEFYKSDTGSVRKIWVSDLPDNSYEGIYTIKITLNNEYTALNPSVVNWYEFDVDVQFNCALETISSSSIGDMAYTIRATETLVVTQFSVNPRCTLTYSILVNLLDPTDESKLPTEERDIVQFNPTTQTITVHSNNNLHGDKTITIQVKAALSATNFETISFNLVTTKDCSAASLTLNPAVTRSILYQISNSLPTTTEVPFEGVFTTDDANCEPFTYQRVTFSTSNTFLFTEWQNDAYKLGTSENAATRDVIWQDNDFSVNKFYVKTDDNQYEANSESTTLIGPILINVEVDNRQNGQTDSSLYNSATAEFTVTINPDCSSETISVPVGPQNMLDYTIYDSTYTYTFNDFTLSRTVCSISNYEVSYDIDPNDPSDGQFVTFNSALRTFNVQTNDNKFGDKTFTITIKGITELLFESEISFTFQTIKMCGNVQLAATSFTEPIYYYALTSAAYSFSIGKFSQINDEHATEHCDTIYEVQYKIKNSGDPWTTFSNGMGSTFIQSFDQTTNELQNTITVSSDSISMEGEYILKIVGKVQPTQLGVNTAETTAEFEILSLCNAATFTAMADITKYDYFIREDTATFSFTEVIPSWLPEAEAATGQTSAQLGAFCGDFNYVMYRKDTNSTSLPWPSYFTFNQNTLEMTVQSDDPLMASSNDQSHSTVYEFSIEGQMVNSAGVGHWRNKVVFDFTIEIKDYCWTTTIMQNPNTNRLLVDTAARVKEQIVLPFIEFVDSITYDIQNNGETQPSGEILLNGELFPVGYSCSDFSYSAYMTGNHNYVLNTESEFIQYHDSNKTVVGFVLENTDMQTFTYEFLVSSNIYSGYTDSVIPLVMDYGKCKPNNVKIPEWSEFTYNINGGMRYKKIEKGRNGFAFLPLCPYQKRFTASLANGTALPKGIKFDINQDFNQWFVINVTDGDLAGQSIEMQVQLNILDEQLDIPTIEHDHKNVQFNRLYNWTLHLVQVEFQQANEAPFFKQSLVQLIEFDQTQSYNYTTPAVSDDTGLVEITYTPSELRNFMEYRIDKDTLQTTFQWKPTLQDHYGEFSIMIKLYDNDDDNNQMSSVNVFGLIVNRVQFQVQEEIQVEITNKDKKPIMILTAIDDLGIFYFEFDEKMIVPEGYEQLDDYYTREKILVVIRAGIEQDRDKVQIDSIKITKFTENKMELTVAFKNPLYISMGDTADQIRIEILDTAYFVSAETGEELDYKKSRYIRDLPYQMIPGATTDSFMLGTFNLEKILNIVMLANVGVSVFFNTSLTTLWSLMNSLQLTLHLSALNIKIPKNTTFFSSVLLGVVQFDIMSDEVVEYFYIWKILDGTYLQQAEDRFEMESQMESVEEFDDSTDDDDDKRNLSIKMDYYNQDDARNIEDYSINYQLIFCDYDSSKLESILGTLFIIMIYCILFIITVFIIRLFERIRFFLTGRESKHITRLFTWVKRKFFWNGIIRFIMESYLETMIVVFIGLHYKMDFGSYHLLVSNGSSLLAFFVYGTIPFILTLTIFFSKSKIARELYWVNHFKKSKALKHKIKEIFPGYNLYGEALFENIRTNRLSAALLNGIFLMRRMLLAYTLVNMAHLPLFQAFSCLLSTFFYMMYIGFVEPFTSKEVNRLETFNEFMLILISYTFLLYTDYIQDIEMRYLIGWITISGSTIVIFVNVLQMCLIQYDRYKVRQAQKRTQKAYEKRMKEVRNQIKEGQINLQVPDFTRNYDQYQRVPFHTGEKFNRMAHLVNLKVNEKSNPTKSKPIAVSSVEMSIIKEENLEESVDSIDKKIDDMGIFIPKKVEYKLPQRDLECQAQKEAQINAQKNLDRTSNIIFEKSDGCTGTSFLIDQASEYQGDILEECKESIDNKLEKQSFENKPDTSVPEILISYKYSKPKPGPVPPSMEDEILEQKLKELKQKKIKHMQAVKKKVEKKVLEQAQKDYDLLDDGDWSPLKAQRFELKE